MHSPDSPNPQRSSVPRNPDKPLTLIEHLEELRSRIIKSAIAIVIGASIIYVFVHPILLNLVKPVGRLVFIAPHEAFTTNIKIALFGGLFLSLPFVLYQIWRFVASGLKSSEKRYALVFGLLSFIFFMMGALFGYFVIVPLGIRFLLGFATDFITPMITMARYVSFVGTLTFTFGVIFELPLIILFLTKIGVITPQFLSHKRRHAIVSVFILAAILTPPDVITQAFMALPLLILYELGILFSKIAYRPID